MYCKDCKKWDKYDGICNLADWVDRSEKIADNQMAFYADAHDDSGLCAGIKTGPLFGCIRFEPKKAKC